MIVYTAITGCKDKLKEFPKEDGVKYLAYSDGMQESQTWEVRETDDFIEDPYMRAKWYKILPHRTLETDVSLWIDGNISLKMPPTSLLKYLDGYDIAFFKHSERQCSYTEALAVVQFGYDKLDVVQDQMRRYFKEGLPSNYGLTYNGFILRRHTKEIEKLDEFWWGEILHGSRRDQLSLMYSCWKLGIKPNIIDIGDVHHENEVYRRGGHNYESKV